MCQSDNEMDTSMLEKIVREVIADLKQDNSLKNKIRVADKYIKIIQEHKLLETIIHDNWVDYLDRVLPRNAGSVQVIETRRAFYSGAACALAELEKYYQMLGGERNPASEYMQTSIRVGMLVECINFMDSVGKGEA